MRFNLVIFKIKKKWTFVSLDYTKLLMWHDGYVIVFLFQFSGDRQKISEIVYCKSCFIGDLYSKLH